MTRGRIAPTHVTEPPLSNVEKQIRESHDKPDRSNSNSGEKAGRKK